MDGLELVEEARAAGLTLLLDGGNVVVRGPRRCEPLVRRIAQHKPEVLRALIAEGLSVSVDDLSPEWRCEFEERSAIMEYDGGLPKERAEALALVEIVLRMRAEAAQRDHAAA